MLPLTKATKHYMGIKSDNEDLDKVVSVREELESISNALSKSDTSSSVMGLIFKQYDYDQIYPEDRSTPAQMADPSLYKAGVNTAIRRIEKCISTLETLPEESGYASDIKRLQDAIGDLEYIPSDKPTEAKGVIYLLSMATDLIDQIVDSLKTDEILMTKSNMYEAGDLVLYKNYKYVWKVLYVTIAISTTNEEGVGYMITCPASSPMIAMEKQLKLAPQGAEYGDEVQ